MQLLNVAQLNTYLRALIDADQILHDIWVAGEIVDFKQASSGHWYFKLKEGDAILSAACWRSSVARIAMRPRNGDAVLAHGRVGFYEASGALQLYVDMLQPNGVGLIYARFEELKARLEAEGLFDASRKRELPALPTRIGVVTSPTGAVIRDILQVLGRRYPLAEVVLAPCKVQGDGAAASIVEALTALYAQPVDVIIVARGGGSAEDLWAFNEEPVARAVFASPVPIVSGVGHETDVTIIDFVADVRAPTPSAAAELVAPTMDDLQAMLQATRVQLSQAITRQIDEARVALDRMQQQLQRHSPVSRITRDRQRLDELLRRGAAQLNHHVALRRARLEGLHSQLAALGPRATLARGYAVVRRSRDGTVVTTPAQVTDGQLIEVTVTGGSFAARRADDADQGE